MHMADALLAPAVAATMYAASAVTVGASVNTLRKDEKLETPERVHTHTHTR